MPPAGRRPSASDPASYGPLAAQLELLAFPVRLAILEQLKIPRRLADLRILPTRKDEGLESSRAISRQAVERHLKLMVQAGFVVAEGNDRDGRTYRTVPSKLFVLQEELGSVSRHFEGIVPAGQETVIMKAARPTQMADDPRLVLVHGVYEGKAFRLAHDGARSQEWLIGRKEGLHVCLEYDPHVSTRHSTVIRRGSNHFIRDAGSKNGTFVNWIPLEPDEERKLVPGAVVGVGRSLLVFGVE